MPKIAIIGNSAAGNSCLQALISGPSASEITVICEEEYLPYRRDLLIDYIGGKIEEKGLFTCPDDFYQKNNVTFQKNSTVIRLDTKKQRLILKDNSKINYDYLIIASGARAAIPDIPGKTKDGVFSLYTLEDAKEIKQRLSIINNICLVGEPGICLALSEIIASKDKEVKVISPTRPEAFTASEKSEWIELLLIQEIIGEGSELKALKLSNGKVLEASMILFCGNYAPALGFLKETEVNLEAGYIVVDDNMRTASENIFACGSVCNKEGVIIKEKSWLQAQQEGITAARSISGLIERGNTLCQQTS